MTRPSTIDELPEEIRSEIGRLRLQGATIDRILEHLRSLYVGADVSRSALGRHVKKMAAVGDRLRRSREVTEALVRELGDAPASKSAQLNIELMHSVIFDLFNKAVEDPDGVDDGGKAALAGNPMGAMMLAKALDHLTSASRKDADFVAQVEKRAAEKAKTAAAKAAEAVCRERGLSADTAAAIRANILGIQEAA